MVAAAGPFGLGPLELGLIVLVLLMLFGATRLADLGGSLGKGIKEFRRNVKDEVEDEPPAAPAPMASAPRNVNSGPEVTSALKCPSCGNLNPANARLCNQCGTSLQSDVAEKSQVS